MPKPMKEMQLRQLIFHIHNQMKKGIVVNIALGYPNYFATRFKDLTKEDVGWELNPDKKGYKLFYQSCNWQPKLKL